MEYSSCVNCSSLKDTDWLESAESYQKAEENKNNKNFQSHVSKMHDCDKHPFTLSLGYI